MFYVEVKKTNNMGRGVFACKDFKKGEIIEICPVVPLPEELINRKRLPKILGYLEWWFFEWGPDFTEDAMILGYGMLYNHSDNANAIYKPDLQNKLVYFTANKLIKKGDEIFIDYRLPGDHDFVDFGGIPPQVKDYISNIS